MYEMRLLAPMEAETLVGTYHRLDSWGGRTLCSPCANMDHSLCARKVGASCSCSCNGPSYSLAEIRAKVRHEARRAEERKTGQLARGEASQIKGQGYVKIGQADNSEPERVGVRA